MKSNHLLEPIQEYEKRENRRVEEERMRSATDVSRRNTQIAYF